jgi:hypothetical protein
LPRISFCPSLSHAWPESCTVPLRTSYSIDSARPCASWRLSSSRCSNTAGLPRIWARTIWLSRKLTVAVCEVSLPSGTVIRTSPVRVHCELTNSSPEAVASCASTCSEPCVIFTRRKTSVLLR